MIKKRKNVVCKFCNKRFSNYREHSRHVCPNQDMSKKWKAHIGRNTKKYKLKPPKIYSWEKDDEKNK